MEGLEIFSKNYKPSKLLIHKRNPSLKFVFFTTKHNKITFWDPRAQGVFPNFEVPKFEKHEKRVLDGVQIEENIFTNVVLPKQFG